MALTFASRGMPTLNSFPISGTTQMQFEGILAQVQKDLAAYQHALQVLQAQQVFLQGVVDALTGQV